MAEERLSQAGDPTQIIYDAMAAEQMENPDCPVTLMLGDLLARYQTGDKDALELALQIANLSLAPRRPNILVRIANTFLVDILDKGNEAKNPVFLLDHSFALLGIFRHDLIFPRPKRGHQNAVVFKLVE